MKQGKGRPRKNGKTFRFVVVVKIKGRNYSAKIFKDRR